MTNINLDELYYSVAPLLSQRCLINMIVGIRGGGKTYDCKRLVIKRFLNKNKKFIWLRRYQVEIDKMLKDEDTAFWGSVRKDETLLKKWENLSLTCEGQDLYINNEHAGQLIALSTSMQLKSIDFDDYTTIVFDEFIVDKGKSSYLRNEVHIFLEFLESVIRLRKNVQVILIGNAISIVNPYFTYFNIKPDLNQRFTKKDNVCVEFYFNDLFLKQKEKSTLGRLIKGTEYGEYNMKNKFLRDSDSFIATRPESANIKYCQFIIEGEKFSMWFDKRNQRFYIDRTYQDNFGLFRTFVSNPNDMTEDKSHIIFKKTSAMAKKLLECMERGDVFFCDQSSKQAFYNILLTI